MRRPTFRHFVWQVAMSGLPSLLALAGFVTVVVGGSVAVVAAFGVENILWALVILLAASLFVALTGSYRVWKRALDERDAMEEERDDARRERDDVRHDRDEAIRQRDEARGVALPVYPQGIIKGERIYIADLVRGMTPASIKNRSFFDCHLIGPAMLIGMSGQIRECTFYAPKEGGAFLRVPEGTIVVGGVALEADLVRCELEKITLIVPESRWDEVMANYGDSEDQE